MHHGKQSEALLLLPLPPPGRCPQVWQVISQRRQEGAGGLARLHSALISTGGLRVAARTRTAECTAREEVQRRGIGWAGVCPASNCEASIHLPSHLPCTTVTHLLMRLGSAAVADPRVAGLLFPLLQHATNLGAPPPPLLLTAAGCGVC